MTVSTQSPVGFCVPVRPSRARYVGTQPELEVKYRFNRHLDLKGIFNYFRAGKFLKQSSNGSDITYLGSMLTFRF